MPAKRADSLQKLAALSLIDQRNERIADFQAEFVKLQQLFNLLLVIRLLFFFRGSAAISSVGLSPLDCPVSEDTQLPPARRKK